MSDDLAQQLEQICENITLPLLDQPLSSCSKIRDVSAETIAIELQIPFSQGLDTVKQQILEKLSDAGVEPAPNLRLYSRVESYKSVNEANAISQVKNIIAVASGKGGVGKSTTTVNLALALQHEGARVGILDADIFGPSQSMLAGTPVDTRPDVKEQKYFVPIKAHGLQFMSMGFLVTEQTPMVWRGPKASGAFQQMLTQTAWEDLDYLLVDMPPGTGDIQLTLSQNCPLTAAVIVTTPQDIALLDAVKGIEMFRKVDVPILGIIENMSVHICSNCNHSEPIFGEGGGERIANTYDAPLLGKLPLDINIRLQADSGKPTVATDPDSEVAKIYRKAALTMVNALTTFEVNSAIPNVVSIS